MLLDLLRVPTFVDSLRVGQREVRVDWSVSSFLNGNKIHATHCFEYLIMARLFSSAL